MKTYKIGSPLFILRDSCAENLPAVLTRLKQIGFDGVELLGLFGHTSEAVRHMLDENGLEAVGNHVPFDDFLNDARRVINDHRTLGCGYITIAAPPETYWPGGEQYPVWVASLNEWGAMTADAGMKLMFHNHAAEMVFLEKLMDDTKPDCLYLEPDLGWMRIADADPAYYLKKYAGRCPVIHFKDYYRTAPDAFVFRPVGYGEVENARLFALSKASTPAWYVMDHDCAYERDPYGDLALSLSYFKQMAYIHGN